MKYFFILGSNLALSLAELSAVFNLSNKSEGTELINNILLLDVDNKFDPTKLIKTLGGTIKVGIVEKTVNRYTDHTDKIIKLLNPGTGKFKFGFSYYGPGKFDTKALAMKIKNHLRERKISCRWVTSKERTLSSVVVEQNKLTGPGLEIVLIADNKNFYIGRTLAVQPFKELSYRDYGRPERDDKSGMIPPKLAQIMINLARGPVGTRHGACLLDPFCGSGTVLTEAALMGFKNIIGSDKSIKAVNDTKKNIVWINKKFSISDLRFTIHELSATELSKKIKANSIDLIITEPYLGPQRGKINIKKIIPELNKLYSDALKEFKKVLRPKGRVAMVWPIFRVTHNLELITPNLNAFKIVNPIPENLQRNKTVKLTNRNTIIYGREGQRIWREIVLLAPDS